MNLHEGAALKARPTSEVLAFGVKRGSRLTIGRERGQAARTRRAIGD